MSDRLAALHDALAALAPPHVRVGVRAIDQRDVRTLAPSEALLVANARPVRRHEFATGRALLHDLLDDSTPIVHHANGAPAVPAGMVATLAHDATEAVAAVATADAVRSLGIDIERADEDDEELHDAVVRGDDRTASAIAAFVIKEAAFKAWTATGGAVISPLDIRATQDGDRFVVHFPNGDVISGRAIVAADRWLALAVTPA